jgi:prepilin-type N-terminal cleavage/methylation domain-containing protein
MFKPKLSKPEQGFTMVEVLVAILIATIFIIVTMQMMVIAAVFKVRAQEYAEATTWIQKDLENVKYNAAILQYTALVDEATGDSTHESTDTVLHVASVNGFQAGDKLIIGTDSTTHTIAAGGVDATNKTITLTATLGSNFSTDTVVVATTRCTNALDTGFADGLRDLITGTNQTGNTNYNDLTKTFQMGKEFRLRRTTSSDSPYNVLKINYDVSPTSGGESVASFYTEVIPNAALQCPK